MMRLDKFLADAGTGTRSEVKTRIRKGQITVNGVPVQRPEQKVDETVDVICQDGIPVLFAGMVCYMLNKPAGYVSSTTESDGPSVLSLMKEAHGKGLFPAGRLDKDTEGLLLVTNDGMLAHRLLSPGKHVPKTYFAKISGIVTGEDVIRFREGLDIGDERPTRPAELTIRKSAPESEILLTICEGRFHQVKRMFEAVGKQVLYLKRLSMGGLSLDEELVPGAYRELTAAELARLSGSGEKSKR